MSEITEADEVIESTPWPEMVKKKALQANRDLEEEVNVSPVMVGEEIEAETTADEAEADEADEATTKVVKKATTKATSKK